MGCTPTELLERLTPREYRELVALDTISPIGSARDDYNSAMIAYLIAVAHSKRGHEPKLETFIPFPIKPHAQGADMVGEVLAWAAQCGAEFR